MTGPEIAALTAAALLGVGALFQFALAAGVPLGEATFGGRAPTNNGVLTGRFRIFAAVQGLLLLVLAWIVLGRAGMTGIFLSDGALRPVTWGVVVLMAVNTAGNATAPHPVERWGMGFVTLAVTVLTIVVALRA